MNNRNSIQPDESWSHDIDQSLKYPNIPVTTLIGVVAASLVTFAAHFVGDLLRSNIKNN